MAVGLRGLLDPDSGSRRRIFGRFILCIVIILSFLHYKLALLIVHGLLRIKTNYTCFERLVSALLKLIGILLGLPNKEVYCYYII
jgi:hypothetical protein